MVRQHTYCGKTNTDGIGIGIACAKSCKICTCDDDIYFSFVLDSGESKSCDWLKNNYSRQQKYCQRECDGDHPFIGSACPESCHWCPVLAAPTVLPTPTPTKSNAGCQNDDHFMFKNEWGLTRGCDWLKNNQAKQHKYCDSKNADGINIDVACADACDKCCEDDLVFTFVSHLGETKSCGWLKDNEYMQDKYCSRECNEYPFIGDACPESYKWCPLERKF